MKRKTMIIICCVLTLCALAGCQLAQENEDTNADEDRLVGVFVTTEYLDLIDSESYIKDKGLSDGDMVMDEDTEKYQGRLYAVQTSAETGETIETNKTDEMMETDITDEAMEIEETDQSTETEDYVFNGVEGFSFFSVTVPDLTENDSYKSLISDPAISEGNSHYNYGDETDSTTLDGIIYASPTVGDIIYYFNPVYQSADGSVYLTSGDGLMMGDLTSEGDQCSQTLDAAYSVSENGKTKTKSISVKLSIGVMFAPEKIVILQMDADSKLLARMEYTPGELPETFSPEPNTAYLVVETHKRDTEGAVTVARDIYSTEAESIETFFTRADGICIKQLTEIIWK